MCKLSCSRENGKKACVTSEEQSSLTQQLECFCIYKSVLAGGGDGSERMAGSVPIAVGQMGLGYIAGEPWQRGRG